MSLQTKTSRRVAALANRAQTLGPLTYPGVLSHFLGGLEARTEKLGVSSLGPINAKAVLDLLESAVVAGERLEAGLKSKVATSSALPLPTSHFA